MRANTSDGSAATVAGTLPGRVALHVQAGLRARGAAAGVWIARAGYLQKWLVLGVLIGVIAGLGAVLFYTLLRLASHVFLGLAAGYFVPQPAAEDGFAGTPGFPHWWLIPLIVCAGGLLCGALVYWLAPEAEGHGTNAAIDAVHRNPRMIRSRAVVVKMIASAITIGSGGSGGREGPTAQISAGFGSLLARVLNLSPEDGRTAVSVGIGSGIGAIFGAPLGGAVLCADIIYRDDFDVRALVPGLISSVVSFTVWGLIEGFEPMFGYAAPGYRFNDPLQLVWFAVIGVGSGLVGLVYAKSYYRVSAASARLRVPGPVRPAIGGLLVGLLALAVPEVLGTGYGWAQHALGRQTLLALPLAVVIALPFAKILATSLSIGTGGSGGIFGPGTVIGGFFGAAVWRLAEPLSPHLGVPISPAPFVIVGMMACFGGIARAPLAMMLMVAEMTGSLTILAPAMVAVGISYLIVRRADETIYRSQLRSRSDAQAARLRLGLPLLGEISVARAMVRPRLVLSSGLSVADAIARLRLAGVPGAPVIDPNRRFEGTVDLATLREGAAAVSATPAPLARATGPGAPGSLLTRRIDTAAPTISAQATLAQAVEALPEGHGWLTVVDDQRHVQGVLAISDVVRAYQAALRTEGPRIAQISANSGLIYVQITEASPVIGHTLAERQLPAGVIVVSVRRDGSAVLGPGTVRLKAGDQLTVLASREQINTVRSTLAPAGDTAPSRPRTPSNTRRAGSRHQPLPDATITAPDGHD